jgi:hypothetical protein
VPIAAFVHGSSSVGKSALVHLTIVLKGFRKLEINGSEFIEQIVQKKKGKKDEDNEDFNDIQMVDYDKSIRKKTMTAAANAWHNSKDVDNDTEEQEEEEKKAKKKKKDINDFHKSSKNTIAELVHKVMIRKNIFTKPLAIIIEDFNVMVVVHKGGARGTMGPIMNVLCNLDHITTLIIFICFDLSLKDKCCKTIVQCTRTYYKKCTITRSSNKKNCHVYDSKLTFSNVCAQFKFFPIFTNIIETFDHLILYNDRHIIKIPQCTVRKTIL